MFSSSMLVIGFQNCSKIAVQDMPLDSSSKAVSSDNVVAGNEVIPDSVQTEPEVVVEQPGNPTVISRGDDDDDHDKKEDDHVVVVTSQDEQPKKSCDHDGKKTPKELPPVAVDDEHSVVKNEIEKEKEDKDDKDDDEVAELVSDCLKSDKDTYPSSVVRHLRGSHVIANDNFERVEDIRGKTIIKGVGKGAKLRNLIDAGGKVVVCNMEIEFADKISGNLTLVNSTIKLLGQHNGVIKTVNSPKQ
jgi:hypothetical protein